MFETTNQIAYATMDLPIKHDDYPIGGLRTQGVQSYVIFVAQGTVKNQSDVCCSISEWISILGSVYIYIIIIHIYI